MSDTKFDFTAQAIDIAFDSVKQRLRETIEGIDLVPPQLLDEIISGSIAIGSLTGAFMLSGGIIPDEEEQASFTRSFLTINQKLLDLQDEKTAGDESFYGFMIPTKTGWVIVVVRNDGQTVMTSDPLRMNPQDARRHVIEKLHGSVNVKWIDHISQIDIPAVREAWTREIESNTN